jgi:hypothetical protein
MATPGRVTLPRTDTAALTARGKDELEQQTQKSERQPKEACRSSPPTSGPSAMLSPNTPPQTLTA